jgi:pimeloyl-ACP methyl ester carboxylesterase
VSVAPSRSSRPVLVLLLVTVAMLHLLAGCLAFHPGPLPGEPKSAAFAEVNGVRVRYLDVGKGPVVVLVHGFASSLETWSAVVPVLAREHRVIALDLKGFGWSGRPEGDYSPRAQAELIFALLDQRGVESAALVAHSWGASIALEMALLHPSRVSRLALYDAWVYEEQIPTFFVWSRAPGVGETLFSLYYGERPDGRIAYAFYDKERFVTEKLVTEVERALERPGTYAAALAAVRGQRYTGVQKLYAKIAQPTLLLWGREDQVTLLSYGERLSRDLKNARLVVYPRCGHFPMLEAAGASTGDLQDFLAEDEP